MPSWALALEAASMDPVRAREIYEQVDEIWWRRFRLYHKKKNEGDEYLKKKMENRGSTT